MPNAILLKLLAAAIAIAGATGQAQVASFPTKALRIVVPTSPGSGSDITARYFGEQLGQLLGQTVVIENKPGANGVIAAMAVKQAPADGYTLFLGTNTHMAVNPSVVKDIPYDGIKDFKPVSGLARGMMIFIAPAGSKIGSVAELVSAAKSSKQRLNVGNYTAGFQLSSEWFASTSATQHVNIMYKGAPEVFTALMGNQLDWAVSDLIAAIPQVKAGKLRAIAVSGDRRHPDSPEIPTVRESGYPDYVNYTWTSLYIRSETPEAVTTRLVDTVQKILATPGAMQFIAKIGSDPMPLAPADMRRFQISETERFRRIAEGAGIKPE
ncbi:MAG: tripartite tricarboxylate transporter substrate binding protein [Betaproteobacteria bacterium]|nr:tripartite tricarboxylate transporter substrate binding protein [Betaproteobacteria bacterium]